MRIFGHVVAKNEADRYLADCVEWHLPHLDGLHVFDDASTDGSGRIASDAGAVVSSWSSEPVSFTVNEAGFREAAWRSMEEQLEPAAGDWILCIDADEFFMPTRPDQELGSVLRGAACQVGKWAVEGGLCNTVRFNVEELFSDDGESAYVRTDGFWRQITAERLIAWESEGSFASRRGMGGGSVPSYKRTYPKTCTAATIVHAGYLDAQDRIRKYDRYSSAKGHATKHVKSILDTPELAPLRPEIVEAPWRR